MNDRDRRDSMLLRLTSTLAHLRQLPSYSSMASSAGATIPRDIQRFIADYPGKEDDDATGDLNLRFYRNEISSRSSGDDDGTIEEIHTCVGFLDCFQAFDAGNLICAWSTQELER